MKTNQYIGCSGYYYPAWKKKFYPEGLQPKGWLEYYSRIFNTVELNGTFYRTPKPADLKKYYDVTPPDFRFSVKMSKQITHIRKLKETQELIEEFQALIRDGLQEKCMHYLFQRKILIGVMKRRRKRGFPWNGDLLHTYNQVFLSTPAREPGSVQISL